MIVLLVYGLAMVGMVALPLALGILTRRRLGVPWWLYCVGMATFVASQVYHLPLNSWLGRLGVIQPIAPGTRMPLQMAVILGLSAGLSESLARTVGYWILFRLRGTRENPDSPVRRWGGAVMVGLGHGGIEAMLLMVVLAASVASLWGMLGQDLSTLGLPPEQLAALERQIAMIEGSPWLALAPLMERGTAILLHVTLSVAVWSAFRRRNPLYVLAAVAYHAAFDGLAGYVAQFVSNVWLIEGLLLAATLPGVAWMWMVGRRYLREEESRAGSANALLRSTRRSQEGAEWAQGEEKSRAGSANALLRSTRRSQGEERRAQVSMEWRVFGRSLVKELRQQWRSRRMLVVGAVFLVFGMGSPLLAAFTPQMMQLIPGAEQFADLIPTPTRADALGQYIKNLTQFGFLLALLLGMGAVAGEKERGTAALILSKPLPRWAFILSKFAAQAIVYLLAFALAAAGAAYYTSVLFEPLALGPFLLGNLLLWVWLLTFAAVTLLGSTLAPSTGVAAGIGLGGSVALLLLGSIPTYGALMPAGLVAWASQLGLDGPVSAAGGALGAGVVWIVACLIVAVAAFEVQEL